MASLAEKRIDDAEDHAVDPASTARGIAAAGSAVVCFHPNRSIRRRSQSGCPRAVDIKVALAQLQADYALRGVNLVRVANKWTFRTAGDLSWLMTRESTETRRLSRAAIEMLAIIAYHQPVTRAEIEEIRGVITSKGTLDVLLETGWIRPRGRRKTPGRPLTFGTTEAFLSQFSLEALGDLPGLEELKGTGLAGFAAALRIQRSGARPMTRLCTMTRIRLKSATWNWRWRPRLSRKASDGKLVPHRCYDAAVRRAADAQLTVAASTADLT